MSAVFVFACCWLTTAHAQQLNLASTKLVFSTGVPDTLCANSQVNVCGKLTQTCPGGPDMPLVGRPIIFFVNPGNCGNNVAVNGDDTVLTDVNGIACATLTIPNTVGNYAIRIKFLGESKPGPSDPPNSACDTTDRVSLSASNECETFIVTQTAPPIADNPATPVNLFQCVASQVCFQFTASGGGTLTWTKASGSGTLTAGGLWCFTPVSAGAYSISAIVANACGGADTTSLTYNITLNGPPVIAFGNDTTIFQCTPAQICLPYTVSDPQGLAKLTEVLISGSGTIDTANNRVCLTPPSAGSYQIIVSVTDSCGASDRDTIVVTVGLNSAPVAANPPSVTVFQCVAAQLCHTFTATDVNGGTLTWTKLSGTGTVTPAGLFCFTPSTSGSYNVVVTVADSCGAKDTTSISYTVTVNSNPVAVNPSTPVNLFQCTASQVCFQFTASDVNGGALIWSKASGSGTLTTGGLWCFTPVLAGAYSISAIVADSCGRADTTTLTYNITLNAPPVIAFGSDTTIFQCTPAQICLPYTVSDPQGLAKLTEVFISGYGAIDTLNNRVCFTPASAGSYQMIVSVTDSCGASDRDTIVVTVSTGAAADITCPVGPIPVSLCDTGQVCYALAITPAGATVTTNLGTYSAGQLCFTANASGTYNAQVIATTACGADTCNLVFNVTVGQAASITCPPSASKFICSADQVCLPMSVIGSGATVTVSPIGTYVAGQVCFQADSSGVYNLTVIASTSCGADTCQFTATVTINSAPIAVNPASPLNAFLCVAGQICNQFTATDVNGGTPTWTLLSGAGTVSSTGQWCFTASATGSYSVVAKVADSCGAADTVNMTVNVTINSAPVFSFGNDTTITQCAVAQICLPFTKSDPNGNIATIELLSGSGTLFAGTGLLCFVPSGEGTFQFIARAVDSCGAEDRDTINVTIDLNAPPLVTVANDTSIFLCAPAQICRTAFCSDPDNNLTTCELVSGPGALSGNNVCFTPNASGVYTFIIKATDACGLTDLDTTKVTVTVNAPPLVTVANDTSIFLCAPAQICRTAFCSDPDNNLTTCELVSGPGALSGNNVCFTPNASGVYTFIIKATDACGLTNLDTTKVTVTVNAPPLVTVANDTSIFLCAPAQICRTAFCSDPDNNLTTCELVSGPGALSGNNVCFTPNASGVYTFIIKATDACGLTDLDTTKVTVTVNAPPLVTVANDTSIFLCAPAQICRTAFCSDPDNNLTTCELVSGPGALSGNNVCFTPNASGVYTFIIKATDACGLTDLDTTKVTVTVNNAPIANAGKDSTFFVCGNSTICWSGGCSDPNNNLIACEILQPAGATLSAGQICLPVLFGAGNDTSYTVIIKATDACGATDLDTAIININFNSPPVVVAPPDFEAFPDLTGQICFDVNISDPDNNIVSVLVSPVGVYSSGTGQVCFNADTSGVYCLIITATDACNAVSADTVCVTALCVQVQIEEVVNVIQGQYKDVSIFLNGSAKELAGYDLLISYDASALSLAQVTPGTAFLACGWEYFTFRFGPFGNCGSGCPSGIVRITAIADINNGANHPDCYLDAVVGSLAVLSFLVTNDRTLECQFSAISFYWIDCGDNGFSSVDGDTLWVSQNVFSAELDTITNNTYGFPGAFGIPNVCIGLNLPGKPAALRCVDFTNGGINIICADSIDGRGDINLDGLMFSISDAVMFTNYFVQGLGAFQNHVDGSIAASDVNADGNPLTVADLVYLIRIVVGDAPPVPKVDPNSPLEAEFVVANDMLIISHTDEPIGGLFILLNGKANPTLGESAKNMDIRYEFDGTHTRVLIFTMEGKSFLESGGVLKLDGAAIKSVEVGGFSGSVIAAKVIALPTEYSLSQNYPNPFNPVTTINFDLPKPGEWTITIYNLLGQSVETMSDTYDAGSYKVEWDAGKYASGIYFYRLTVGSFSATKKMVLLK